MLSRLAQANCGIHEVEYSQEKDGKKLGIMSNTK